MPPSCKRSIAWTPKRCRPTPSCAWRRARGAEAIGLGDVTGSLEPGKRADLIQVAFEDVHHVPTYDVKSHLVYVSDEQDVASVVVDGRILMRERTMLTDRYGTRNETKPTALAAAIQAELARRNR